jgi:hypothetical protein
MLELLDLLASSPVLVDLISSPLTPLYTSLVVLLSDGNIFLLHRWRSIC